MRIVIGGAVLALFLAGCGDQSGGNASSSAPIKQIAAPEGGWTEQVVETAEGGFRMGNPNAPVKLIEYGSLSCPHCAEFSEQGSPPLRENYVKSGQVSWEFRPYILFPTDPGVTLLLRCQGAAPFFQLADQLYADQRNWMTKIQTGAQGMESQLQSLPPEQVAAAFVRLGGLDEFFRLRGMPQSRIESCLANGQAIRDLVASTQRATQEDGVTGTPAFLINGKLVPNAASWAALEPSLRAAIP
jgi:protein-disulfide isomerase